MSDSTPNTSKSAFDAPTKPVLNTLVIIQPDGTETRETYETDEPALEQLQRAVGGLIEVVHVDFEGWQRVAFVNEEGKLKGLRYNKRATNMWDTRSPDVLVGPIVILVPASLTLEQKIARAVPEVAKARAELGEDLAGYAVTDFLADHFTSWTLAECREVAEQMAVRS